MDGFWFLTVVVFVLVAVAAHYLQRGLGDLKRTRRDRQRRLASLVAQPPDQEASDLQRRASRWDRIGPIRSVRRLIMQSGTSLSGLQLTLIGLALMGAGAFLLPVPARNLRLLASALFAALLIGGGLRAKRARRLARFGAQLPDVIDVIVRSLRAGHPLSVSLNLVAREMPEPAGLEFKLVVDEVNYGRSLSEALDNLSERVGYPELRFFVASTAIAHQTGGNLGEILSRLSRMLRERFRLSRRVRALSAEGRFSGYALSVLPVALFGIINLVSASYYAEFWKSAAATPVIAVSIGLLLVGNLVIYRLVNFKV